MKQITIKDVNESISVIENIDIDTFNLVSPKLCVKVPNAEFTPKYKIGLWDGLKRFYKLQGVDFGFPKGLVPYVIKKLVQDNIEVLYEESSKDVQVPSFEDFKSFVKTLNIPFEPYDYQIIASYEAIRDKRKICLMSTSSGKSLTVYMQTRWMLHNNYKTVIIVPTVMLTTQLYEDFRSYGMHDMDLIHIIGGDNKVKHFDKPITISTWQSLYKSPDLFEDVDCLICDEAHLVKSATYEDIISPSAKNTIFRTGYTGTLPTNMVDKMVLLSVIGAYKKYITPRQLIEMGLATEVQIKCLYFNYPLEERQGLKGQKYPQEVEYLTNHPRRNKKIAQIASKISNDGNTIVLFDRVEHGEQMAIETVRTKFNAEVSKKELQQLDNPYKVFLVTGNTKASVRESIRQLMEQEDDIIMFGTSSILSTGVNIKRLKHLVLASGGKSSIKINQSIGRLLRKHVSKAITTIWDIVDDLTIKKRTSTHKNYFYKHYEERLEIYSENEYNIIEKEVNV